MFKDMEGNKIPRELLEQEIENQQKLQQRVADQITGSGNAPAAVEDQIAIEQVNDQATSPYIQEKPEPKKDFRQQLLERFDAIQSESKKEKEAAKKSDKMQGIIQGLAQILGSAGATHMGNVAGARVDNSLAKVPAITGVKDAEAARKQNIADLMQKFKLMGEGAMSPFQKESVDLRKRELAIKEKEAKSKPKKLSEGQKALDKKFAGEYADYVSAGGGKEVESIIGRLGDVINEMKDNSGMFSGPLDKSVEYLGGFDTMRAAVNPDLQDLKSRLEQIIQGDLRRTLGAQFTEKEGKNFMERSFDPKLTAEHNIRRTVEFLNKVKAKNKSMLDSSRYFEKAGTLQGYKPVTDFKPKAERIKVQTQDGQIGTIDKDKVDQFIARFPKAKILE